MTGSKKASRQRIIIRTEPGYDAESPIVEFRLTYEGKLLGATQRSSRARHKHEIRKVFHHQLRRLWEVHPYLSTAYLSHRREGRVEPRKLLVEHLAEQNERFGYNFVPLVTESLSLVCSIDVLFLRPSIPGQIMQSGDLDNRLKTLFDALQIPQEKVNLGGYDDPDGDERPFFCLLTDDKLISHVAVETDMLLQSTNPDADDHDARLVITVRLRPFDVGWDNISFG